MISVPAPYKLDPDETETLLYRLQDWRYGICPSGKLSNKGCFVLAKMPSIIVQPDITKPVATQVITDSKWTENLVENGTIQHINDNALINTLADLYMLFSSNVLHRVTHGVHTVHAIQIRKYATISMDAILRPTDSMKKSIEKALAETDVNVRWNKLLEFWDEFGYFWPRKIVFGYRIYIEKSYSFNDRLENFNQYHSVNSALRGDLNKSNLPIVDIPQFLQECVIVGRNDLTPLHELLDKEWRVRVDHLIKEKFGRILINQPIKLYNRSKKSYLGWSPRHNASTTMDNMLIVKPLQQADIHTEKDSHYIWTFNWTNTKNSTPAAGLDYDVINYRPQIIRGSERVFIFPGCKTKINIREPVVLNNSSVSQATTITDTKLLNTDRMILSCRSYHYQPTPHPDPRSRIRQLKLIPEKNHTADEITNWAIEYHHNILKYITEHDYHVKLNINEHIRRVKPLVQGDEIQLQQIGLLTAFDTDETNSRPSTSSPILYARNTRYFQPKESLIPKTKRSVMCMDEDMVQPETVVDTYWLIELATEQDQQRHGLASENILEKLAGHRRPNLTTSHTTTWLENGHPPHQHQYQQHQHQPEENESYLSLRRTHSDSSVPTFTNSENHEDRAAHFENLTKSSTSKLLMKFMKRVTLQPFVHFVNPGRTRQSPPHQQSPPVIIRPNENPF
ncbi:hypothetical protein K501DRAFT_334492 [Backusella circina FSU 941]|nr:hypothetical protein K501DRAFT_334492 [Backusella circina FSU 941]